MYRVLIKPFGDFLLAIILLILLTPLCLLIMLFLFVEHNGKVFFIQKRAKLYGKPFNIMKFRTLTEEPGFLLMTDEQRLTKLGNFLRATSLDELPQLINIIKGDMSFIGPRPLYVEYNDRYSEHQRKRLLVKPGITGWAQIHGGNTLSWKQKFDLDVWYVDNNSFATDITIFLKTISYLLLQTDLKSKAHMSAKEFEGNLK